MKAVWWKRSYTAFRWCLWSLLALLILVLVVLAGLLGTQPGSRWVLDQVREPLPLALGEVTGTWLTGLNLGYVTYEQDGQRYHLENFSFRWQPLALLGGDVSIQSLRARHIEVRLPAAAAPDPAGADEEFALPDIRLPFGIQLEALELRQIVVEQGETSYVLPSVSAALSARGSELRVHSLSLNAEPYQASLAGRVTLAGSYPLRLDIQWAYNVKDASSPTDAAGLVFRGRGQLSGDLHQLVLEHQLSNPQQITTHLELKPNLAEPDTHPELVVTGHWPRQALTPGLLPASWPALETQGQLNLTGWLNDYRLALNTRVQVEDNPALNVDLQARGTADDLALERVQLDTQQGRLQGDGRLAWVPEWSGELRLSLSGFNPATLPLPGLTDWPGNIQGDLAASLSWVKGQPRVQVPILALSGRLRDRPLRLSGRGSYKGQSWNAESIDFTWGENRAQLSGSLGDSLALDLNLDLTKLHELYAGLEGSVVGQAKMSGTLKAPVGHIQLDGRNLAWQGHELHTLSLTVSGAQDRHQLSLAMNSEAWGRAQWSLTGAYAPSGWQGEITELSLHPLDYLAWELETPAPLDLNPAQASVSALCLVPRRAAIQVSVPLTGELCLEGQWLAQGDSRAEVHLRQLPLDLAQRWLPPEIGLSGSLEGQASFEQPAGGPPRAQVQLQTREGALRYPLGGGEDAETYVWKDTRLRADWQPEGAKAQLSLDWEGLGQGAVDMSWRAGSDELAGQLRLEFTDLAPLEALAPFLHEVTGQLTLGAQLAGSLAQPELQGQLRLTDASAKLPAQGLFLQDVNLKALVEKNRLSVSASLKSDPGSLRFEGHIDRPWAQDAQVEARLNGEAVTAVNLPELKVQVSPDLQLQANRQELRLEGTAHIPVLLARFKNLPESAVQVSEDVMIAGAETERDSQALAIYADLNLELGEEVRLEGFGLKSRLTGELNLLHTPARGLTTLGQVSVTEGRYKAYGQDLTIERGQLLFQGPYNNPGLDIRATRTAGEQVAGLEIGGTLQRPRSRVFSEPSLPDSEAMSILFTGKSLSRSSSSEASMLVNAIGGLGLERSGFITAEIASTFNLDEFRVQAEDDVTQSSLHIGKRLTPRIFVRYAVGLFDRSSTLGLRYDLTEQLHLDAESGLQQSLDLIYKLERD